MNDLEQNICTLVTKSLEDNQFVDAIFFPLPPRAIQEIGKIIFRSKLKEYQCEIHSNDIRHSNKSHEDDILYVCKIPEIVQDFSKVIKSITTDSETGRTIVSIEFYKRYGNKEIKLVKMDLHKNKILRLKTIFVKNNL